MVNLICIDRLSLPKGLHLPPGAAKAFFLSCCPNARGKSEGAEILILKLNLWFIKIRHTIYIIEYKIYIIEMLSQKMNSTYTEESRRISIL